MIAFPAGVKVWIAGGVTDMRRGMNTLALQVQQGMGRDPCAGYTGLYLQDREPDPTTRAFCWAHARRKFFELADIVGNVRKGNPTHDISPIALEAVQKIDAIFDIERDINGL